MQFDTARPLYYCSNLYYTSKYHRYYMWLKSPNPSTQGIAITGKYYAGY